MAKRTLVDVVPLMAAVAVGRQGNFCQMLSGVTRAAIECAMRSGQRVFCLGVVIKSPASPTVGVVTKTATSPQPALVMIILVATRAGGRGSPERCSQMTFFAWYDRVPAYQRKASQIVVEAGRFSPAGVLVTFFALRAELSPMRIIFLMTGDAGGCQFVAERADVTGIALHLHMRAAQGILCLIVIESRPFPVALPVTSFTFGPVAAGMNVLDLVAGDARCADPGVALAGVTR
jgi:hypothetical protein